MLLYLFLPVSSIELAIQLPRRQVNDNFTMLEVRSDVLQVLFLVLRCVSVVVRNVRWQYALLKKTKSRTSATDPFNQRQYVRWRVGMECAFADSNIA